MIQVETARTFERLPQPGDVIPFLWDGGSAVFQVERSTSGRVRLCPVRAVEGEARTPTRRVLPVGTVWPIPAGAGRVRLWRVERSSAERTTLVPCEGADARAALAAAAPTRWERGRARIAHAWRLFWRGVWCG